MPASLSIHDFVVSHAGSLIYATLVLLLGGLLVLRVRSLLRHGESLRKRNLLRRSNLEAIKTETPLGEPADTARDRGLQSIEKHATVLRRTLIPFIALSTLALALLPLMAQIPATLVSVLVAVITVTAGIAARPVLENAIAGLVISFSRLINIGDTVEIEGKYGTVEDITTTHTTIKLWDWRRYVLPNTRMLQSSLLNLSVVDRYQWAYVEFWVSFECNLDEVRELAIAAPKLSAHFAAGNEEPQFWIMELGERGIRCWIAAWANTPAEAWELKNDIRTHLGCEFHRRGILPHLSHHSWRNDARAPIPPGAEPLAAADR